MVYLAKACSSLNMGRRGVNGETDKERRGSILKGPLMYHGGEPELCILCSIRCDDAEVVLKRRVTQLSLES